MYDPIADFKKHVLPNGLEVYSAYWDRPWVGVQVIVHAGAREDPIAIPGVAHFLEHCVSGNIPNHTYQETKLFFENVGGTANFGATGYLHTTYKFVVPAEVDIFREALTLFGSMLMGARIEKDVEKERKIIQNEFHQKYPSQIKVDLELDDQRAVFPCHPIRNFISPLGRPEGFMSLTEVDLQKFCDQYYTPANMSVIVLGGFEINQVVSELTRSPFGQSIVGIKNWMPPVITDIPLPLKSGKVVRQSDFVKHTMDQSHYAGLWAFPANFSWSAWVVFFSMLEELLFEEIREKRGLTYGMRIQLERLHDISKVIVHGRISHEGATVMNDLVQSCIVQVPLSSELFVRKLTRAVRSESLVDLSGVGVVNHVAHNLIYDQRIITLQESFDSLKKVTFADMIRAAECLSVQRRYSVVAVP